MAERYAIMLFNEKQIRTYRDDDLIYECWILKYNKTTFFQFIILISSVFFVHQKHSPLFR
jgi:hypothetical protein